MNHCPTYDVIHRREHLRRLCTCVFIVQHSPPLHYIKSKSRTHVAVATNIASQYLHASLGRQPTRQVCLATEPNGHAHNELPERSVIVWTSIRETVKGKQFVAEKISGGSLHKTCATDSQLNRPLQHTVYVCSGRTL